MGISAISGATARTSSPLGRHHGDRARAVTFPAACPFVKTVFQLLERIARIGPCAPRRWNGHVAVARARPRDPLVVRLRPAVDRRQRALARARSQPEHRSPLHRDARTGSATSSRIATRSATGSGPRVLDLGFSAINSMDVREISAPHLRQLSDETEHTVNLAILDGNDVVYIERCRTARPGQREIDLNLHVGARLPAYCTAMGKAILAYLPEDRREEIIARSTSCQRGPNTLTDRRGVPRGARADPRARRRGERRGARLRAPLDRRADPPALGRGRSRRSTSPSTARWCRRTS